MEINKETIIQITPEKGFLFKGPQNEGYKMYNPYIERNVIERVLREICFRCPFLPHKIWYNKRLCKEEAKYVIVSDPLITVEYLKWIQNVFPNAQLNFLYGNMVGKAKHVYPSQIPEGWRIWTYDDFDSKKYGLRLFHENGYFKSYIKPLGKTEYDVIFVGKDKGRGEYLLQLEEKMKSMGLRTKFVIVADGRLTKRKSYYSNRIDYNEITKLIVKSRAILNIAMEDQQGITLRDLESLFFEVKLLTTNKNIVKTDIYSPDNVYIVDGLNIDNLPEFLDKKYVPMPQEVKERHSYDHFIEVIIGDGNEEGK